jgi:hypothetical protein
MAETEELPLSARDGDPLGYQAQSIIEKAAASRLQLGSGEPKGCASPICRNPIPAVSAAGAPKRWRRTARRFCSDRCRVDNWILARAARLLFQLEPSGWWEILDAVKEYKKTKAAG